jgi:mannose-6-phosphate isomerase-like protein (cupin superfamily)
MRTVIALVVALACGTNAVARAASDRGPVVYWSADDLKSGRAPQMPLRTATHLFKIVKLTPADRPQAESHEGTSDIFFVVDGAGTIVAGGDIDGAAPLAGMPGEIRGRGVNGGRRYEMKPGAIINIPPSTPYVLQPGTTGLTAVQLRVNVGMHPWSIVQTQQTTLAATDARPRVTVPVNSEQGGVMYWSADELHRAHMTMAKAAADQHPMNDPRDLVAIPATRTHAYNFLHRIMGANGQPPAVEFHEGNTDIYFIVAGTGTLMTAGDIENRRHVANRPGEDQGSSIRNGVPFRLKAGDVVNMPPSTPHQSIPDPGGFTYMLVKVNVGVYPWALIEP